MLREHAPTLRLPTGVIGLALSWPEVSSGTARGEAAKAYRLLRAVLMTAVNEDELLRKNPCRIPGADREKPAERPVLTLAQVPTLADLVDERYRALVLVTTFACLRWMGRDSAQAAMIYQHATSAADRATAQAVSDAVRPSARRPEAAGRRLRQGQGQGKAKGKKRG